MFEEGHLSHLPRASSDHCPILLNLLSLHIPRSHLKPFRFQAMWLKHVDFSKLVKHIWETQDTTLVDKIWSLVGSLKA